MEKKKIVLLGDSIRMGYDKYVKEALADVATDVRDFAEKEGLTAHARSAMIRQEEN